MTMKMGQLAWDLYTNLREEVLKAQEIRSKIIEVKITFIGTLYGASLIFGKDFIDEVSIFIAIPAFAAVFFDFLIQSYSFSIKRIGAYCRECLDPVLKTYYEWNEGIPLWEGWQHKVKQHFSTIGNLGLTFISVIVAVYTLIKAQKEFSFNNLMSVQNGLPFFILIPLFILVIADIFLFFNFRARIDKESELLKIKVGKCIKGNTSN